MAKYGPGDWLSGKIGPDGGYIPGFQALDGNGNAIGGTNTYYLAGSVGAPVASLAAGATTSPVTIPAGQSSTYGWSSQFSGTSPTLVLEALQPDGVTYATSETQTVPGTKGVVVFTGSGGSVVRLRNAGTNPITNLTSALNS